MYTLLHWGMAEVQFGLVDRCSYQNLLVAVPKIPVTVFPAGHVQLRAGCWAGLLWNAVDGLSGNVLCGSVACLGYHLPHSNVR
ncbi:hypothetical protein PG984_002034 [Apiospora sp. TS-2023a]